MNDQFDPFNFQIPSNDDLLLDQLSDFRFATECQINQISQNQQEYLKYTKTSNEALSTQDRKNRKRADHQFLISTIIATIGVIVGILGIIF